MTLKLVLRALWVAVIFWGEVGIFYSALVKCHWPDAKLHGRNAQGQQPAHALLVADPQILDMNSYPDRHFILQWLSQVIVDLNMRKSWFFTRRLSPDVIIFLGDMMDRGRENMSVQEYEAYYLRFHRIFSTHPSLPVHHIPGNHDVGLGGPRFATSALDRYITHFGPPNRSFTLSNHTFLLVDAPALLDESESRKHQVNWAAPQSGAHGYVRHFATSHDGSPTILVTHIPLARPELSPCGPHRERGTIHRGSGLGYQNTLGEELSDWLLQVVRPVAVFSGDDHDHCEHTHVTSWGRVPEVTVKSFSMAMGIRHPGFQLLSLVTPSDAHTDSAPRTHADTLCLLPDQIAVYLQLYLPLGILSLLLLFFSATSAAPGKSGRQARSSSPSTGLPSPSIAGGPGGAKSPRRRRWLPRRASGELWAMKEKERRPVHKRLTPLKEFIRDIQDVAWMPVTLFGLISWWAFW